VQFEKDDYLIVEQENKKHLGQVINFSTKKSKASQLVLEKGIETDDPVVIDFRQDDIVCNLGQTPPRTGKILGIQMDIFEDEFKLKGFPFSLYTYRELETREHEILLKVLSRAKKILIEKNAFAFSEMVGRMVLKPCTGKMQGYYKYQNSKKINQDEIGLTPLDLTNKNELLFTVIHEFSHGIWFRQVPKDIQAKWTRLFAKRAELNRSQEDALLNLFNLVSAMSKEGQRFNEISKGLRTEYEEEFSIWADVLKYIKKTWHIDKDEAESLMKSDPDKFFGMWPSVTDITTWKPDVSEYANTSVKEFFAESVAYWLTGTSVPKDVDTFLNKTFKKLIKYFDTKEAE
jgi:hypothetical protein